MQKYRDFSVKPKKERLQSVYKWGINRRFFLEFQTIIWAFSYFEIPPIGIEFTDFTESVYFFIVTFTTLGYGDVTLHSEGRILSGLEAMNGIMLLGWTTAIMFSLIQHIFHKMNGGK